LSEPVDALCYYGPRREIRNWVRGIGRIGESRTIASFEAEINCDSIEMRLNGYNFGSLISTIRTAYLV
jgi:alpha/beta superfamily hydrolase